MKYWKLSRVNNAIALKKVYTKNKFSLKKSSKTIKMKHLIIISVLCALAILIGSSCKKQIIDNGILDKRVTIRKVQFQLYTTSNFSNENDSIFFKISIIKPRNQILFDSMLAPMKIKDIPNRAHKLIIDKTVPGNDASLLKVGFYYTIKNVGNSWHTEPFNAGKIFKVVDFNFQ